MPEDESVTDETRILRFFAAYERRFNSALDDPKHFDAKGMRTSFAKYFVEASPLGVVSYKNGLLFRALLPHALKFYRKIGTRSLRASTIDLTQIDEMHWMAKVAWDSRYQKKSGEKVRVPFEVTYFLQMNGQPKIFAFVAGDEKKVLKEHGVI